MTVVQWADGNVLTAGSLRLIPQLYSVSSANVLISSGTAFQSLGSVFVSGGLFAESLLFNYNTHILRADFSPPAVALNFRVLTSGAGLGGGSVVSTVPTSALYPLTIGKMALIGSNAGWIPGSDCVVFVQLQIDNSPSVSAVDSMTLWGTGKP